MVPPDTALELVEVIRAMVPVVTGTSNPGACLLYTSDAADDSLRVDLGGRRIIKKFSWQV